METITEKTQWSFSMRANHWGTMVCILILIPTGFYIADPFTVGSGETTYKFLMGNVRYVHYLFGVILMFLFIWRLYIAFFSGFQADWKDFFAWTDWKNTVEQIKFYSLISDKKHAHEGLYGPLQSIAYAGVMIMIALMVITGMILAGAGHDAGFTGWIYFFVKPLQNLIGGLATVRFIHHILTWLIVLFMVIHIYMAFWNDVVIKEGTVSSLISGRALRRIKQ